MSAKDPDSLMREEATARTEPDSNSRRTPESGALCADYNGMALEEWKATVSADLEDRFGPLPSDLVPVGEAGW